MNEDQLARAREAAYAAMAVATRLVPKPKVEEAPPPSSLGESNPHYANMVRRKKKKARRHIFISGYLSSYLSVYRGPCIYPVTCLDVYGG